MPAPRRSDRPSASALGRRGLLLGIGAFVAAGPPSPAEASYALYKASQDSFVERKTSGFVPVATSDINSLAEIQSDINKKRPRSELQLKKAPQYCAGQMSSVQPMMENVRAPPRARCPRLLRHGVSGGRLGAPYTPRGSELLTRRAGAPRPQICANIGISKADQSNTRKDSFGNMNVGAYSEMLEREAAERAAARRRS